MKPSVTPASAVALTVSGGGGTVEKDEAMLQYFIADGAAPHGRRTVAVIGLGVIGTGWCALFLARGFRVVATDANPASFERCRQKVATDYWEVMHRRGLVVPGASVEYLAFAGSIAECVSGAYFVQENVAELLSVKQAVLAEVDDAAPADALVASSSSFIPLSVVMAKCKKHPGRVAIGHPTQPQVSDFMEIMCADDETTVRLKAFYEKEVGMQVVVLRKAVEGHLFNTLFQSVIRDSMKLVREGACSGEDIDKVIVELSKGLSNGITTPLIAVGGPRGAAGAVDIGIAQMLNARAISGSITIMRLTSCFGKDNWLCRSLVHAWLSMYALTSGCMRPTINNIATAQSKDLVRYCNELVEQVSWSEIYEEAARRRSGIEAVIRNDTAANT